MEVKAEDLMMILDGVAPRYRPFAYLRDVLGRLSAHTGDRLGELLPDVWFEAHPRAHRKVTW